MTVNDSEVLAAYERYLRTAQYSPVTIKDRLQLLGRLCAFLSSGLLAATPAELEAFQQRSAHLSRNTVDIYTRHVLALYKWLVESDRLAIDPTRRMVRIKTRKGLPHPISPTDLRTLLACAPPGLRLAYVLAAFAGLRAGEITRLRAEDLHLDAPQPTALIQGKGGRERTVPLLPPVVVELRALSLGRRGVVVLQPSGRPFTPSRLSVDSSMFMSGLGISSTLHSCRHYFASEVVRLTRDVLLTRDLLGHASVATTQIYMASTLDGAQDRLAGLSGSAAALIQTRERSALPR